MDKVAFSPNGAILAVGDANASAYLWNVATRTPTATLTDTLGTSVQSLAFSPNGASLAVLLGGGTADLWDVG